MVSWGDGGYGGDSSTVQEQLKNVQQIQASSRAFAAILGDGSVVIWGADGCRFDSIPVQNGGEGNGNEHRAAAERPVGPRCIFCNLL